jgi:hypothetical protein
MAATKGNKTAREGNKGLQNVTKCYTIEQQNAIDRHQQLGFTIAG